MKKTLLICSAIVLCSLSAFAQFTANRLLVLRIGDSTTALSATSLPVAIEQYTLAGAPVNTTYLPRSGANAVSIAGSATSEGHLSLATNSSAVTFFAYRAPAYTATVAASTALVNNRVVINLDVAGTVSIPTFTDTKFSASNPRCVVTDGTSYWGVGANTGICRGTSTSNLDTVVSNSSTNIRFLGISGGQMYYSTASGTSGIWRAGSGIPTSSGTVSLPYIGTGTGSSPYGFAIKDDSTVCYIADDRVLTSGGGIQKWTRSGSTWTLAYTLATGTSSTVGARSIVVNWTTANPTIYAVTAEASANRIITISDAGSSSAATTVVTAGSTTVYRGVSMTPGSVLPVTFRSFNAEHKNNTVLLKWSTASELNNYAFEVQRSSNGKEFETIATVKGAGNSNKVLNYSYTDQSPVISTVYYRLKQVDFDGRSEYTNMIPVMGPDVKAVAIESTAPNPFSSELTLDIRAAASGIAQVELIDLLGKQHYASTEMFETGSNRVLINTASLPDGIYLVRVSQNGETFLQKVIRR